MLPGHSVSVSPAAPVHGSREGKGCPREVTPDCKGEPWVMSGMLRVTDL